MRLSLAKKGTWPFIGGTLALAGACVTLVAVGLPGPGLAAGLLVLLVGGYVAALRGATRQPAPLVLLAALLLRLATLPGVPAFSDDVYRYIHEGRASRLGLAVPYQTPPAELTPPPDDGTSARVNHPEVPAAYPPTSQLALLALVGVGDAVGHPLAVLKLAFVLVDLAVLGLLFRRRRRRGERLALARYGLHPLPLLEVGLGAHLDVVGVGLLSAGVLLSWRPFPRGFLLGLAMGVKPIAVLGGLAGPLRGRALGALAAGVLAGLALPLAPYVVVEAPLHRGLVEYGTRWEAAPTGYALVERALTGPLQRQQDAGRWTHALVGDGGVRVETAGEVRLAAGAPGPAARVVLVDHRALARVFAGGLLLIALGLVMLLRRPLARVAWALAALWLLAPTLHPWYLLWLLPFAALLGSRALLGWAAVAPLLYQARLAEAATGVWEEAWWPRLVVLTVLAGGAVLDERERRKRGRSSAAVAVDQAR